MKAERLLLFIVSFWSLSLLMGCSIPQEPEEEVDLSVIHGALLAEDSNADEIIYFASNIQWDVSGEEILLAGLGLTAFDVNDGSSRNIVEGNRLFHFSQNPSDRSVYFYDNPKPVDFGGIEDIYRVGINGGTSEVIIYEASIRGPIVVSSNGRFITYNKLDDQDIDVVYLYDSLDQTEKLLNKGIPIALDSDSQKLLIAEGLSNEATLQVLDFDGTIIQEFDHTKPDGAYWEGGHLVILERMFEPYSFFISRIDLTDNSTLDYDSAHHLDIKAYSRSLRKVALQFSTCLKYDSNTLRCKYTRNTLFVLDLDTGEETVISSVINTPIGTGSGGVAFSPDENSIAYIFEDRLYVKEDF